MEQPKDFEVGIHDEELQATHKWFGKEDQTEDKSIFDKGQGAPVTIRHLEFKLRPDLEKLPTKEEILTPEYVKYLHSSLWGDGLRMVLEPRVRVTKDKIDIFVPCQATTGNSFLEEPKYLQEWIR